MAKTKQRGDQAIGPQELMGALGLQGSIGESVAKCLLSILNIKEFNRIQAKYNDLHGAAFASAVLNEVGVTFHIPEHQLSRIPSEGGFITVSNHHYGSIDGLILQSVIGERRPDFKILTTFFLALIPGLRDCFIPVDNFSSGGTRSVTGIRSALEHIKSDHPLGLFPAGEVASWQHGARRTAVDGALVVEDKPWADNMIKLIRRSGLPVIPIYFDGGNSKLFHILGQIHPRLRTLRLTREMLNKHGLQVEVRIGQPITPSEVAEMDLDTMGRYIRNRCYALQAQCIPAPDIEHRSWPTPVAQPVPTELIQKDLEGIVDKSLFESGDYRVYLLRTNDAPHLMKELYRLREETFRAVGEGTGLSEDTISTTIGTTR